MSYLNPARSEGLALHPAEPAWPEPELVGNHSLYRVLGRLRAELAAAGAPADRRAVLLGLVALEFGEGVANALRRTAQPTAKE